MNYRALCLPFPLATQTATHPRGGALGVFAHVDQAWAYSFVWDDNLVLTDIETFRSVLSALLSGKPAGAASDYFGTRYGEISTMLSDELNESASEQKEDKIAWWWIFNHDTRNYTFIGDPAVRVAVAR